MDIVLYVQESPGQFLHIFPLHVQHMVGQTQGRFGADSRQAPQLFVEPCQGFYHPHA